jgi:hypothetical protein
MGIRDTVQDFSSAALPRKLVFMERVALMRCLEHELDEWTMTPFDELKAKLKDVCAYERGEPPNQYQVEVQLLESTPEYVHVWIGVDSGTLRAFKPLSASFLVFRDGRVDRPAIF